MPVFFLLLLPARPGVPWAASPGNTHLCLLPETYLKATWVQVVAYVYVYSAKVVFQSR